MRADNVDIQVLSPIPVMFCYWAKAKDALKVSEFLNDFIAKKCTENPKKFIGLGTVPLQSPKLSIKELERCKEIGLKGVEIGTNINNKILNHIDLHPFYEAAENLGMSIFVHPWQMMGMTDMNQYWLPWLVGMPAETSRAICSMIFGGIFQKFPKLRVAFAHGGGTFPYTLGRIEKGFLERPDLCAIDNQYNPKESIGKFYVDSLVHSQDSLSFLINTSSLGMVGYPDLNIDLSEMKRNSIVYDIVYSPLETNLLNQAKKLDFLTINGLGMLLEQAAPAFNAWFNKNVKVTKALKEIVIKNIENRQ